jgi:hypothetical protein
MAYQNEMIDVNKVMEKVPPYPTWMPDPTAQPPTGKMPQNSLKSHQNSHDK